MRLFGWFLGMLVAVGVATGASAQSALRLPAGAEWKHPHSGIELPATLGGIERSRATAFAADNLDVALQFDTADGEESLSVYVYRNTNGDASIWFAQAQMAVETRDIYGGPALAFGPEVVTLPGRDAPGGLRAIYRAGDGSRFSSTGIALFAVGDWYLKIRASSGSKSADELKQWMDEVLSAIVVPDDLAGPGAIAPVANCPSALVFKGKAKNAKRDGASDLFGGIIGRMILQKTLEPSNPDAPAPVWCRDPCDHGALAVFRPNASMDSYLIALGDAGKGISVGEDVGSQLMATGSSSKKRYSVTLHMPDRNTVYAAQDRLPTPKRAYELLEKGVATSSVSTWGEDPEITIIAE